MRTATTWASTSSRDGVAAVTPARYLELWNQAKLRKEQEQARQRAIQALIGQPAPEFPQAATWLNSKPLTWASLRGKVVILDFWAEWCGPCRNDMPRLRDLNDAREANGLTVIGVHPPGSPPEAIKKVIDEFHLDYPTCVDVPPEKGVKAGAISLAGSRSWPFRTRWPSTVKARSSPAAGYRMFTRRP